MGTRRRARCKAKDSKKRLRKGRTIQHRAARQSDKDQCRSQTGHLSETQGKEKERGKGRGRGSMGGSAL